jgi:hypothetical protein
VSLDYYTRLGRGASESVLNAVAAALQLNDAEREYLLSLTLSVILLVSRSAADGPPGLQSRDLVLVQEILEGGRWPGRDGLAGRW